MRIGAGNRWEDCAKRPGRVMNVEEMVPINAEATPWPEIERLAPEIGEAEWALANGNEGM